MQLVVIDGILLQYHNLLCLTYLIKSVSLVLTPYLKQLTVIVIIVVCIIWLVTLIWVHLVRLCGAQKSLYLAGFSFKTRGNHHFVAPHCLASTLHPYVRACGIEQAIKRTTYVSKMEGNSASQLFIQELAYRQTSSNYSSIPFRDTICTYFKYL